ncbi:MAG: hypothetical protein AAF943_12945 [Pseudomonadota bacterium]
MSETELEALFEQARAQPPAVSEGLVHRVLGDAAAQQRRTPFWRGWPKALGGLPGLGGLATSALVGVWLGVAPPASLPDFAGQILGFQAEPILEFDPVGLTGIGWDIDEG